MTDNVAMSSKENTAEALGIAREEADEAPTQPDTDPRTTGAESLSTAASPKVSRFRRWRKSRPFWGGLFTLLAGLEIAAIPLSAYKIILVATSVTVATVTGVIIAILGLVTWLTPSQSKLYGLLTVVFGVVSFVTSNVGGFLVGGLLAIIGGALTFAWDSGSSAVDTPKHSDGSPSIGDIKPAESSGDASVAERPVPVVPLDDLLAVDPTSTDVSADPAANRPQTE